MPRMKAQLNKNVDHPLCKFDNILQAKHSEVFFKNLRSKVMNDITLHLEILENFDTKKLTPLKLQQLLPIIDFYYFNSTLLRFIDDNNIKLTFCVVNKPKEDFAAIVYYIENKAVINILNYMKKNLNSRSRFSLFFFTNKELFSNEKQSIT